MRNIVKYLFAALLIGVGIQSVWAANGIIETQLYSICPGDELELNIGEQKRVFTRDTIVYDTIAVTSPTQDSIYVYVINTYPNFIQRSTLSLEIGSSFEWHGQTIDKPGSYQDIHKNVYGCDSAYYLTVTERLPETVFYTVLDTTICEGNFIIWNGVKYTSSDVVYKVKHGAAGDRDSVYILHLTVAPISRKTESVSFTSWPAHYRDSVLPKPGAYEFRYIAKNGCDSIITVIANQQVITLEEQATICAGETFPWQGSSYGEAGQYQKVVKTKDGLHDSIYYRLTLNVLPKKRTYITKTICRGGSITFNGKTLSDKDAGLHTATIKTAGCDSIVQLTLVVAEADTVYQVHQLLDGETYKWNGKDYTEAGVYFYSTTNVNGCDSTVQLTLTTKHVARKDTTVYICEGDSYTWHGITGSETYDYSKIVEEAGEMTVYTLHLIVSKIPHTWEEIQVDQFPYTYREYEFTAPGSHDFKYLTSKGCDSIITVVANKRVIVDEQTVTICPGTTYKWGYDSYQEYGETGIYQVTEKTKDGTRDSIYHVLNLTVRYIPTTYVNATICQGESYSFGGATLFTPGMYTHKFKVDGCDSTVVLSLNIHANDTILRVHQVQDDALPLTWADHYWTGPGVFDKVEPNQFGCDSVTRFILTTHHVDTVDTVATICQGETLVWHGITGRETRQYTNIETLPNGDQVIYRLDLTVKTAKEVEKQLTMCQGTSASFNGKTYTKAGTYYDRYNCDTIFRVVVTVNPVQVYVTNATLVGSSYTWKYGGKEKVLTDAGTYTETIENEETGCIDTYRLILKKDDTPYSFEESVTVCEGEDFVWHGKEGLSLQGIGTTTDYTDEYQTVGGKDSIYTLHLTVLPIKHSSRSISFCSQFEWRGKTYTESAVVYDTVASSVGCDSIIRVYLDKAPTYLFHDTVTIVQGEILNWYGQQINQAGLFRQPFTTVNGCDSIYELGVGLVEATQQLPIYTTQRSICEGDVFTWNHNGKEYSVSGTYIDTVKAANIKDPDTVHILNLKVWPVQLDTIVQHLYACGGDNMIRYNGVEYTKDTAVITKYRTIHNCDSVVKTFLHFNTALFQSDTLHLADIDTTRIWHEYKINHSGTYRHKEKAEGECYNVEELVVYMHTTYRYVKDTAICQTEIPYRWLDGPQEPAKLAIEYAHEPGITKTYEHKYKTQDGYDSIFVLNLTIYPTYELRQQIHLCENESRSYNGKTYYGWEMKADSLYRDTIRMSSKDNCDSILFMEIIMHPVKRYTETKVLPQDSVLIWNGITITKNGTYTVEPTPTQAGNGCDSIVELRAVFEDVKHMDLCALDTPYTWRDKDFYTSGLWKDTVTDPSNGQILEVYVLDLTVTRPVEKTLSLRGCLPEGVTFNDKIYLRDTIVNDTLHTCDTIYTLHINVDTAYIINIVDTICEHELPYILGRIKPDTIWQEGFFTHDKDTTMLGCDSIINLTLRIIPSLDRNDSTFVCEDFFASGGAVYLGDTVSPWFDHDYHGKWEGKWHGVKYTDDTIVYNCDSSHFHHIIKRPSQKTVKDTIVYICPGDTIAFSAFRTTSFDDTTRFVKDTIYEELVPMTSKWTDERHHITYNNDAYTCDSITRWHVKVRDVRAKDTTAHKLLGDSIWWNGVWRYHSGDYDSIAYATDTNILGDHCPYIYTLHLIMDTAYYFRDTIYSLCTPANKTHTHIWTETQHKQKFTVGNIDTIGRHYIDSLKTHESRDSIYDLFVIYSIIRDTLIYDTICAGDKYQFHQNRGTVERWLDTTGRYSDTIQRTNPAGCDSIITLQLYVRPSVVTTPKHVNITDRELPYKWKHEWMENGLPTDSTDTLLTSGLYTFRMPNRFGCDSIDSLYLSVHYTHVFSDTIDTCSPINTTLKYTWATNYVQTFTTPNKDSLIHYYDTLNTRIKLDSIYDLYVHFHRTYETHIYDTICAGDSAFIDTYSHSSLPKRFFKETGIYHDTVPTFYGCDSIFTLHLQVWPSSPKTHQVVHRADVDTPYVWEHVIIRGLNKDTLRDTLYATGEYSRRLENIHGCDSIDSLSLFFHKTWKVEDETINLCKKETPFIWNNQVITRTGDYVYKGITKEGYDSICTVHVNVWPQLYDTTRIAICDGDSVLFNGQWIKRAGKYDVVTTSTHGCDSTHTLILTINQPYYRFERQDIYSGETYTFFGKALSVSGTYKHKNTTPAGCDSITELQLVVHPVVDTIVTICANDLPYRWINKWKPEKVTLLHSPGVYHDDTTYVDGIRTFWSIDLRVNEQKFNTIGRTICQGASFTFNNRNLTKPGTYRDTLTAVSGCDSIVTLILQVSKPQEDTIYQTICAGSSYHFNNQDLLEQGEYRDTLTSQTGCDSIVILKLRVLPTYHNIVTRTIYAGDTVHFHGETYADPGRYQFRHTSASGCDSIIELNLIVNKLFDDSVAVCQSELPYTWHNKEIWKDGIYRDTTLDSNNQPVISGIKVRVLPVVRKVEPIVVTICEGASYPFKGQFLTQQGIYYDTLTSRQFGCDSIITLTLQVIPQSFKSESKSIFEGDSILFYNNWLKTAGTYVHQEDNGNNCYNTHELVLTVLTAAHRDTTAIVCEHDLPYIWNNVPYYKAGDYEQRTVWNDSAHVITTLHLSVNQGFYAERNVSLCEGSTFIYKNKTYTKKGSFYDTIPSLNGCDSIIKYIISVHPTYDRIDTVHIADKDSCKFHGRALRLSGTYEWDSVSVHGCDSIEHLILIVHPSFYKFDSIDICQGDTIEWRGYRIAKSGLYSDSLHTQYGFDSVYQVRVTVHQKYFIEQQYEITEGNPTYIHGINISQPGVYYDSLYTIHGCDSVYRVVVNWARTFTQHWDVTICQGEEYKFFGKTLTHSGEYTYNSLNKDSVIYLKLTVNPASITEKRIVIAPDSLPYIYNGRTYEKAGIYADTFINHYKCDSIIRLNLVVTNRYSEWDQIPLCPGQTLKIEDRTITQPGSYTFTKRSAVTGLLDSLYRVEVFAAFDYESPFDTLIVCEGDTVMFAGKQLTRGGSYTANLKTVHGCDSILHLFLIINPSYSFPTKATITDYQSFTWRGKEYNTQGIYTQSYPTIFDCDSTYSLDLTVLPTQRIVVNDSICFRDTLRWRDHILTEPGIYSDTICNLASHTSIIYTLNLGVVTPTIITSASVTETAANVESFKIHFSYSGLRPTSYNIIFDELAHSQGFKDIVNKPFGADIVAEVPMPKKEKVVYQEHTAYVKPDYYTMRLALDNNVCGISRSDSLSLLIKYPSWIIEQNWDNVVAPLQPAYNGGYEFGAYKWFINDAEFDNDGLPYIYSNTLKPGDRVVLQATRIGESYAIPTAPLVITKPVPDVFPNPVLVYPNATTKAKHAVTLKAEQRGTYFVYSTTGQLFSTGTFETGEQLIDLPATSGCCLIRATTADGFILTEKIIIY